MSPPRELTTDDGLRTALREVHRAESWDVPPGQRLLAEIRRRAVRNAAHVATAAGIATDRGLVDDVLAAAWMVLREQPDDVLAAARPWAYVMTSAQRHVTTEVRAQQALARPSLVGGGRWREVMPNGVDPVGATPAELAVVFRHAAGETRLPARRAGEPVLVEPPPQSGDGWSGRASWFGAFVDLLVAWGANEAVTLAAVDHLSDIFTATRRRWLWERAARQDAALARLGLSPDQCGALVALVAGSRSCRYASPDANDGVLAAVRAAHDRDAPVELSSAQLRRVGVYVGRDTGVRASDSLRRRQALSKVRESEPALVPS